MKYDVIIIGGGPAGLFSAAAARGAGAKRVLVLERDNITGGILNQCIHSGFGLHMFKEELTGPEYAERSLEMLANTGVEIKTDTMVLSINADRTVTAINPKDGYMQLQANAIVLCMGCRERTAGAIGLGGDRPAGVFSAGAAQRLINVDGYMVGRKVCILGSGDIGLIMARRISLEGGTVPAVFELMPYSGGLKRNIVQCLDDYGIPLYLSHTVTAVKGRDRVEGVWVSQVGPDLKPIPGTEKLWECDALLLSVGLIPENELSREADVKIDPRTGGPVVYENRETSIPGIFAAGNVVHVHDLVDFVSAEALVAGRAAALFKGPDSVKTVEVIPGDGISYTVPQKIRPSYIEGQVNVKGLDIEDKCDIFFRIRAKYDNAAIEISGGGKTIKLARGHMAPGEMERVSIPRQFIENSDSITIKVVEA
ncbi:MAG: FAD-dependent oxidoreductase [Defluviitaleaceae bacterium]|nr:FAD-dependent oxidoreductase [Defluviitaleaceae bacterium]